MIVPPAPRGPPIPLLTYPHDERQVMETQRANFSSSVKSAAAILFVLFLAFLSLFYLSFPGLETAAIFIAVVAASTWLLWNTLFKKR